MDALREAEGVILAASGVNINSWSNRQLELAMNAVCDARQVILREERDCDGQN
jgi:hypothetical protein